MLKEFKPKEHYSKALEDGYQVLPCRFIRLDSNRYVLTNLVGEYLVLSRQELDQFVRQALNYDTALYNDLKSKHFLVDQDSDVGIDLLALKYRSKLHRLSSFTGLHIFVATLRCEHSCPYCQVSRQSEDREAFDMNDATAERALEFTFKSPSLEVKIEFQGGEPLLNFELIRKTIFKAEEMNRSYGKNLEFVIATNLACLEDEHLEFAKSRPLYFSTSLDGPAELHNANRPRPGQNSYEKAVEGIHKIRTALGPDRVSALMTTTERSLTQVKAIIDEYVRQGFNGVFLRPLSPYGFAIKTKWYQSYDVSDWLEFYFEGLDYILSLNKNGLPFVEQYASIILSKMFSAQDIGYVDLQSPAGLGIGAVVFNYDGKVYASDEARMLAEMGDDSFLLGNLAENSYEEVMLNDKLLAPLEQSITCSAPACSDCGFQPYCGSDPVYHHATQRDAVGHKALSGFCKKNMALFRRLIQIMEDDPESRRILLSWVRC